MRMTDWFVIGFGLGLGLLTSAVIMAVFFGALDTMTTKWKVWRHHRRLRE